MPRRKAIERRPRRELAKKLSLEVQAHLHEQLQEHGLEAYCDFKFAPWIDPPSIEPIGDSRIDRMRREARERFIGPEIRFYVGVKIARSGGKVKKVGMTVSIPFFRWMRESEEELISEVILQVPRAEMWPKIARAGNQIR